MEQRTGQQIIQSIINLATVNDGEVKYRVNDLTLIHLGMLVDDVQHLLMIEDLIRPFSENITREEYGMAIVVMLQDELPTNKERIRILHANRDFLLAEPMLIHTVYKFGKKLVKKGVAQENIGTHILAARQFNKQYRLTHNDQQHASYTMRNYEGNDEYIMVVEKYVQHLDALMRFREERGIHIERNSDNYPIDVFDHKAFEEYLSHGALAEGCL